MTVPALRCIFAKVAVQQPAIVDVKFDNKRFTAVSEGIDKSTAIGVCLIKISPPPYYMVIGARDIVFLRTCHEI